MTREQTLKELQDYITTKKANGKLITPLDWLLMTWKWTWANTSVYDVHVSGRSPRGKHYHYSYRKVVRRIH